MCICTTVSGDTTASSRMERPHVMDASPSRTVVSILTATTTVCYPQIESSPARPQRRRKRSRQERPGAPAIALILWRHTEISTSLSPHRRTLTAHGRKHKPFCSRLDCLRLSLHSYFDGFVAATQVQIHKRHLQVPVCTAHSKAVLCSMSRHSIPNPPTQ